LRFNVLGGLRRNVLVAAVVWVAVAGAASAQGGASAPSSRGYVEAVAQSAFGNVTSQSFGGELGVTLGDGLQLFVEGGMIRDAATSDISSGAARVAIALVSLQPAAVSYAVKEPVSFGVAGLRYLFPGSARVRPYALAGGGAARVKRDVTFQLGGADASSSLAQYVTLGSDLSGTVTKPMLSVGAGAVWTVWQKLIVDFQYRYGRVFDDTPINTSRTGAGIGVRF
jgi:opacity protein-like surface antigen